MTTFWLYIHLCGHISAARHLAHAGDKEMNRQQLVLFDSNILVRRNKQQNMLDTDKYSEETILHKVQNRQ